MVEIAKKTEEVRRWRVHGESGFSGRTIAGRTLTEAIEQDFALVIAGVQHRLGSAAGFKIVRTTMEYSPSILGGKGGVEVSIWSHGLDLAHMPVDKTPHRTTVWIHAAPEDV